MYKPSWEKRARVESIVVRAVLQVVDATWFERVLTGVMLALWFTVGWLVADLL